jgi:hypothetical protein
MSISFSSKSEILSWSAYREEECVVCQQGVEGCVPRRSAPRDARETRDGFRRFGVPTFAGFGENATAHWRLVGGGV